MSNSKNSLLLQVLSLLFLFVFSTSCEEESPKTKTGKLEFSVSQNDMISGGRAKALHAILISVKDNKGNLIYDRKKLSLYKFGEQYLSEPISLTTGAFVLTEYIVLDENNAAVYATPLEGSPLAHLVSDPLPINFTIVKDQTTKVTPQVIKVDGATAPDFGYATFSFDIVETFKFYVGIHAYNDASANFQLTSANLTITSGTEVLFNKDLPAATGEINIKDGFTTYTLKVTKTGYITNERTFSASQLKAYITGTPLVITLLKLSLAEGLLAYYPFNGNAEDATVSNFDGIVHGASLTTDRKGVANAAYSFDGVDDRINVPHTNALNLTGDFSISLWAQVSSSQVPHEGINDILRKWNGTAEGYPFSLSYLNTEAADDKEDKLLYVRYDGQGCANAPTSYSPTITNDVFLHIVLVKNGSSLKHYLNNVLIAEFVDTTDGSSCSIGNTADMTIGCRGNLVRFFKGKIDDIRIYSRAITSAEVTNLFQE